MRYIMFIGMLVLLGCTIQEPDKTNCSNTITLEVDDFCRDINMTAYRDQYSPSGRWGCLDENDEIHSYKIEYNETLKGWLIGRRLYKGNTACI